MERLSETPYENRRHQIDLCLLFFLYNAVGDIWKEKSLNRHEKQIMILSILNEYKVRNMFKRLKILKLLKIQK